MFKADLFKVVESRNLKKLRSVLKKRPDDIHNLKNGDSLLHKASQMEYGDVMEVLLQHGLNVNKKNSSGRTALHIACGLGHYKGVLVLREHDADPSSKCDQGDTPFHEAARNGNARIIRYLFNYGFDINVQNNNGITALHRAVLSNRVDAVHVLLVEGVDITMKTKKGKTALDMANEFMYFDLVEEITKFEKKPTLPTLSTDEKEEDANAVTLKIGDLFNEGKDNLKSLFSWSNKNNSQNENEQQQQIPETQSAPLDETQQSNTENDTPAPKNNFLQLFAKEKFKFLTAKPSAEVQRQEDHSETDDSNKDKGEEKENESNSEKVNGVVCAKTSEEEDEGEKTICSEDTEATPPSVKSKEKSESSKLKKLKGKGLKLNNKKSKCVESAQKIEIENDGNEDEDAEETKRKEEENHECPLCFEIPLPPVHIYQCGNGHLYCGNCMNMPNMFNCPQCGVDIATARTRNRYAEENIERLYSKKKK